MIDLKNICSEIQNAALEAARFILKESQGFDLKRTEKKGANDFVSYVDKGSEIMLVKRLSQLLPEAGFITEEGTTERLV